MKNHTPGKSRSRRAALTLKTTALLITLLATQTTQNHFEKNDITEMNKLNMEPLYQDNRYMLAYFTTDLTCNEDCKEIVELMKQAQEACEANVDVKLVYINVKENQKLIKRLRVIDYPSLGYLANLKAVIYDGDYNVEALSKWIKQRVYLPSQGFSRHHEMDQIKTNNNLVVTYAGKRNKYYQMFRYVASSYSDLKFVHSFSAPVRIFKFVSEISALVDLPFSPWILNQE